MPRHSPTRCYRRWPDLGRFTYLIVWTTICLTSPKARSRRGGNWSCVNSSARQPAAATRSSLWPPTRPSCCPCLGLASSASMALVCSPSHLRTPTTSASTASSSPAWSAEPVLACRPAQRLRNYCSGLGLGAGRIERSCSSSCKLGGLERWCSKPACAARCRSSGSV